MRELWSSKDWDVKVCDRSGQFAAVWASGVSAGQLPSTAVALSHAVAEWSSLSCMVAVPSYA
jgi:hypothetical protein